jgi:hypothetical protein
VVIEADGWNYLLPDTITTIGGVSVDEGMATNLVNNAMRRIAAAVSEFRNQAYCKDKHVTYQASGGGFPASPAEGDLFLEF